MQHAADLLEALIVHRFHHVHLVRGSLIGHLFPKACSESHDHSTACSIVVVFKSDNVRKNVYHVSHEKITVERILETREKCMHPRNEEKAT